MTAGALFCGKLSTDGVVVPPGGLPVEAHRRLPGCVNLWNDKPSMSSDHFLCCDGATWLATCPPATRKHNRRQ